MAKGSWTRSNGSAEPDMSGEAAIGLIACLPLAIWVCLLLGRGGFWLARERDDRAQPAEPLVWPAVTAVVPARDEADVIARSIGSLLAQDYPGPFQVVLVDDDSSDGTGRLARGLPNSKALTVIQGAPLPAGWTGKLWAMKQGVEAAADGERSAKYLLLTDADIAHAA